MKIRKATLRRIIREEKVRLLREQTPADQGMMAAKADARNAERNAGNPVPPEELEAAVLEVFFDEGQVTTAHVFDRLRMDGYSDADIDTAIDDAVGQRMPSRH